MKPRKCIPRISKKRLAQLGGKMPFSTIRRGPAMKWKGKPDIIMSHGREVCNLSTVNGRAEYSRRKRDMWIRQKRRCCIGGEPLALLHATFEHENKRGGSGLDAGRNDAIVDANGDPMNGVACAYHNAQRGSRRGPIDHGNVH